MDEEENEYEICIVANGFAVYLKWPLVQHVAECDEDCKVWQFIREDCVQALTVRAAKEGLN